MALVFDIGNDPIPVVLRNHQTGEETQYCLVPLSGRDRDRYLNDLAKRMKTTAAGTSVVKDFTGLHSSLIAMALRKAVIEDGKVVEVGDKLTEAEIQSEIPAKVQGEIYKVVLKENGLSEGDEESPLPED